MRYFTLIAATVLLIGVSWAVAQNRATSPASVEEAAKFISRPPQQRVEIGLVRWGRDLDAAQKECADSGKPILLLFQEVPG